MGNLEDYIQIYENTLSNQICEELIDYFENNKNKHQRIDNKGFPTFTQLNLTQNKEEKQNIHNFLLKKVLEYRDKYYKIFGEKLFPSSHMLEEFRIKRYNIGGEDRFDTHVDVSDYPSAKRFLSFFWYLNSVEEGGETIFNKLKIKPTAGKLVIFPPLWLFPHKGNIPISGKKYILSTYLHYK